MRYPIYDSEAKRRHPVIITRMLPKNDSGFLERHRHEIAKLWRAESRIYTAPNGRLLLAGRAQA